MAPEKNSASIPLKAIADWDGVSQVTDVHQVVNTAFEAGDYRDCIKDLRARGINPEPYVNNLDKVWVYFVSRLRTQFLKICL